MRWIVTANEMRSLENHMIKKVGLSSLVLMENAGAAACRILLKKIESLGGRDKFSFVVLCGPGSNGGDGFVVARHLLLAGIEPFVVLVGVQAKQLRGDVATQCKVWKNLGKPLFEVKTAAQLRLLMNHCEKSERHGCLIDGLFGIGLVRPLSGIFAEVVKWVNFHFSNGFKFSLDLPSGMHPDTGGDFDQLAVQADLTVTFANCKRGMFLGAGPYFCGEVVVADIGISDEHSKLLPPSKVRFNSSDFFADFMLPRERDAHKGDHGHLLVVAGSPEKSGAAVLSCRSAMRAGCGLVTLATPASAHSMIKSQLVEVMSCALDEPLASGELSPGSLAGLIGPEHLLVLRQLMTHKSVLLMGPGLNNNPGLTELLQQLLPKLEVPVVLDADALNALAVDKKLLQRLAKSSSPHLILTPHPGEMGRLLGISTEEVQRQRFEVAREFAKQYRLFLVLKGFGTIIATPSGEIWVNGTGNAAMAGAGMGDVLAGMIAAYLAQSTPILRNIADCVKAAVYNHGLCGDRVMRRLGEKGVLASDLIEEIPKLHAEIYPPDHYPYVEFH